MGVYTYSTHCLRSAISYRPLDGVTSKPLRQSVESVSRPPPRTNARATLEILGEHQEQACLYRRSGAELPAAVFQVLLKGADLAPAPVRQFGYGVHTQAVAQFLPLRPGEPVHSRQQLVDVGNLGTVKQCASRRSPRRFRAPALGTQDAKHVRRECLFLNL
ncbi:MAG: hypothetical protein GW867_31975, partial [Armatimonadetes bacterium]|nr:hypothetical protein [Armatimonadota bacterium]